MVGRVLCKRPHGWWAVGLCPRPVFGSIHEAVVSRIEDEVAIGQSTGRAAEQLQQLEEHRVRPPSAQFRVVAHVNEQRVGTQHDAQLIMCAHLRIVRRVGIASGECSSVASSRRCSK
eukprot:scaffold116842_cov72-Phaeocystis_antarctica.AAC.2